MAFDKDKIKNSLTLEQVAEVLEALGALSFRVTEDSIISETICHNLPGEGSQKLFYYDNTKLFRCYTDCGEYFDIFQLVVKAYEVQYDEEWSLPRAVSFIAHKFGFEEEASEEFENLGLEDWAIFKSYERIKTKTEGKKKVVELKLYDDSILTHLPKPVISPWEQEGITRETMNRYEISYYPVDCQIIIPHRDDKGELIGVRGRTLIKEEGEMFGKYRPATLNGTMYNHPLGFALYGLNHTKQNISLVKKAIVFEGEKSVMLYDSLFGAENNIAVASCGSAFSLHQFELLRNLGVQEIVFAFDRQFEEIGDKEFQRHVKHIKQLGDKYKNFVTISCIFDKEMITPYKASPIDCGKETFLKLFSERIML